jgi:hypothetical protein
MANSKVTYYGQTLIDLTGDTVKPETLLKGTTAHNANGDPIVGTLSDADTVDGYHLRIVSSGTGVTGSITMVK